MKVSGFVSKFHASYLMQIQLDADANSCRGKGAAEATPTNPVHRASEVWAALRMALLKLVFPAHMPLVTEE